MKQPLLAFASGTLVAGKYRVKRVLGQGGMGIVVLANDPKLDRDVALKFLLPDAQSHAALHGAERFLKEARVLAKLKSQHAVDVLEFGEHEGMLYIAMEFLEGKDLAALVRDSGPLPIDVAVGYVLQACEAIAEAHAHGVIHRDLKPGNLFLAEDDGTSLVKVLDFGIAKALDGVRGLSTGASMFLGSPLYASPEQLQSATNVDARADIWALGVVLFELCAGRPPFDGRTFAEIGGQILYKPIPDVRAFRSDVPAELALTIGACLQPDREQRIPNVAALAARLEIFAPATSRKSADRIERVVRAIDEKRRSGNPPAATAAAETRSAEMAFESTESSTIAASLVNRPSASSVAATERSVSPETRSKTASSATSFRPAGTQTISVSHVPVPERPSGRPRAPAWAALGIAAALASAVFVQSRGRATAPAPAGGALGAPSVPALSLQAPVQIAASNAAPSALTGSQAAASSGVLALPNASAVAASTSSAREPRSRARELPPRSSASARPATSSNPELAASTRKPRLASEATLEMPLK